MKHYVQSKQRSRDLGCACFDAAYTLSLRGCEGRNRVQRRRLCVGLLREAVAAHHAGAMYALGNWHVHGLGVKKSYSSAFALFQRAAKKGHVDAQYDLGVCYKNGHGVRRSVHKALYWYRKAAQKKDPHAQCALGRMYEHGVGVRKDLSLARRHYHAAAKQGHAPAIQALESITDVPLKS